ncbi:MAG: di-trans,poly-cis-decaprenylcistransferase [Oscillospiraceae bacterium]|nr:di-trans,poly-cis-decaprenylcistransferase [Oscillospiraceae bacterium]
MIIDKNKLPIHIGFIMDGNGRWASKKGLPRTAGHAEGAQTFRKIARYCKKIGIKYITFYAFSTENWKRPADEVDTIMKLFWQYLEEAKDFVKDNTRLIFLGDKSRFEDKMREKMISLEKASENFDEMTVAIAMNYGGRDDIVHSVKEIARMVKEGYVSPSDIDEELVESLLYTGNMPDADLIIRPGGEKRISNFLIWQSSYAELYFTDVLWPDFSPKELDKALEDYALRGRRFGGVV